MTTISRDEHILHICERNSDSISCQGDEVIQIVSANYGRTDPNVCSNNPVSVVDCLSPTTFQTVQSICDNQQSCTLDVTNAVFGDPCDGTSKYLEVLYRCTLSGNNVALNRVTTQSSTYISYNGEVLGAEKAVDGVRGTFIDGGAYACTHTNHEHQPWWKVDLAGTYTVSHVSVLNRGDCCGERLRNFMVRVGPDEDFLQNDQCGETYTDTPTNGQTVTVHCNPPMAGRYVSIQLVGRADVLTLCEVEVYETEVTTPEDTTTSTVVPAEASPEWTTHSSVGYLQEITFPAPRSVSNYAKLEKTMAQDLTSFTLCLQMRTDMSSSSDAGVVSYAVQEGDNELLIYNRAGEGLELYVQGNSVSLGALPVWDGERHAVCATWRSTDGAWLVFVDGVRYASGSRLNVGGKVRSGGTWILAQEQDTVWGGFEPDQAFSGELSQVNLWDRVLTPAEIGTDSCRQHGNVMDWATTDINVFGLATSSEYRCGHNLALNRMTTQSSKYIFNGDDLGPEKAVDGLRGTAIYGGANECTQTDAEYQPWWMVDLAGTYTVSHVSVLNRGDCCADRLRNFMVRVGPDEDFLQNAQCGDTYTDTPANGQTIMVHCNPHIEGRYVSIQLVGRVEYLSLCEVEVYGAEETSPEYTTTSTEVPAEASTEWTTHSSGCYAGQL
ncbi:pentraxin fusion protein-like [Branchiostoma floridae x Branchiostoma japonicum]